MFHRILVPIDGSTTSLQGLDEAIKLAQLTGASLRLIHVVDELSFASGFETCAVFSADVIPRMKKTGEAILEQARGRVEAGGVSVDTRLFGAGALAQRLSELIVDQANAWGADLIVVGTHGRRGVERLLRGSDAEQIARVAPVPVLLVRASKAGVSVREAAGDHALVA